MNTSSMPVQNTAFPTTLLVRAVIFVALGLATFAATRHNPSAEKGAEAGVNMKLPDLVGNMRGTEQPVSESELHILPKDTEFAKMLYTNFSGDQVNCQIVLSGGEKRSIHRPEICLPAQGWTKKSGQVIPVKLSNGRTLDVMKLVITRPVEIQPGVRRDLTSLFLYWFVGKNLTTPYHWQRILHTDYDRVVNGVSHRWAYVVVSAPVLDGFRPGGKDEQQTLAMLKEFIGEAAPEIMDTTRR